MLKIVQVLAMWCSPKVRWSFANNHADIDAVDDDDGDEGVG